MAPWTARSKVIGDEKRAMNGEIQDERSKNKRNDACLNVAVCQDNGAGDVKESCDSNCQDVSDGWCDDNSDVGKDDVTPVDVDDDDGGDDQAISDIPVDRGGAWLVMISCFLMHVLVMGGGKSFGVFVKDFQDLFRVGAKELGVINGMALMLMLGLGVFVNMLAVRFSPRRVVTAGSVLTSAGFVMTAYIPSFSWLYVTYGLITGVGFALCFSPTIVMVGQCFKKYRTVAFGFAVSGAGLGSFAFPGLARVLIDQYSLRGCLLIMGGIMLNVAICGFMLPPSKSRKSRTKKRNVERRKSQSSEDNAELLVLESAGECCKDNTNCLQNPDKVYCERKALDTKYLDTITVQNSDSRTTSCFLLKSDTDIISSNGRSPMSLSSGHISTRGNGVGDNTNNDETSSTYATNCNLSKSVNFLHFRGDLVTNTSDVLYHQTREDCKSVSTSHLPDHFKPKPFLTVQDTNVEYSSKRISSILTYASNCNLAMMSQGNLERLPVRTTSSALGEESEKDTALFDWSLLRNPPFIMHFFSVYLGFFCYISNLFMLPDHAHACGLDRDTSALTLSVVGILELLARLTFPLITDVLCCRRRRAWAAMLTIMGVLNLCVQFMSDLPSLMTYAVLFGYSSGCFTTLIPVLCAEIKGPEKMGSVFGLTTIAMGLSVMTGPPLCGAIKDVTGYWHHGFITIGVLALISATIAFLEPYAHKGRKSR